MKIYGDNSTTLSFLNGNIILNGKEIEKEKIISISLNIIDQIKCASCLIELDNEDKYFLFRNENFELGCTEISSYIKKLDCERNEVNINKSYLENTKDGIKKYLSTYNKNLNINKSHITNDMIKKDNLKKRLLSYSVIVILICFLAYELLKISK